MKVMVTGGAGYVGSVLVPQLLAVGHEVVVYDSLRSGGHTLLAMLHEPRFSFVRGDVNDAESVRKCVAHVDAVIHLAAIVGFPACRKFPELARMTNVGGTKNVVAALGQQQSLIYASTGSNYGQLDSVCTEDSPLNPVSLYAVTKAEGEENALRAPQATALRFATAFGVSPRFRLDLLVNDFVHQAVVNKQIIVYESHFRRTFIHVRDMARAFLFSLENMDQMQGESYNVGHETLNLTKEQIAKRIHDRVDFYLHFAEIGHDEDCRDYDVSYEKIGKLGFTTTISLEDGIEELIQAMAVVDVDSPFANI